MTTAPGISPNPHRVAIIGAGPSGFYTADALLKQKTIGYAIDIFDRLPAPYGLVRYGVAPDHEKIKSVTKLYDRTLADVRVRYFGNVQIGRDLIRNELLALYDQVVYAVGAPSDRKLNIAGERLRGSLSATEFVAWYNGHPDYVDLPEKLQWDLSCKQVVVVGAGNVALDVARILAKSVDELKFTDIADHALDMLAESRVEDIYVVMRRGPAQVKFTANELKELAQLQVTDIVIDAQDLVLDNASEQAIAKDRAAQRNMQQLCYLTNLGIKHKRRRLHFKFLASPVEIYGQDERVSAVQIERNQLEATKDGYLNAVGTGEMETLPAGLVLRSVGYRGAPLADLPFDDRRGTFPHVEGRLIDPTTQTPLPREYVVGWAKRGPSGIIGTNKPDAVETVRSMAADLAASPSRQGTRQEADPQMVVHLLQERHVRYISLLDWQRITEREELWGGHLGRPRVKMVSIEQMLNYLQNT